MSQCGIKLDYSESVNLGVHQLKLSGIIIRFSLHQYTGCVDHTAAAAIKCAPFVVKNLPKNKDTDGDSVAICNVQPEEGEKLITFELTNW